MSLSSLGLNFETKAGARTEPLILGAQVNGKTRGSILVQQIPVRLKLLKLLMSESEAVQNAA